MTPDEIAVPERLTCALLCVLPVGVIAVYAIDNWPVSEPAAGGVYDTKIVQDRPMGIILVAGRQVSVSVKLPVTVMLLTERPLGERLIMVMVAPNSWCQRPASRRSKMRSRCPADPAPTALARRSR